MTLTKLIYMVTLENTGQQNSLIKEQQEQKKNINYY